jgi:hypothetical protein
LAKITVSPALMVRPVGLKNESRTVTAAVLAAPARPAEVRHAAARAAAVKHNGRSARRTI